jgi:thymidylate kinase
MASLTLRDFQHYKPKAKKKSTHKPAKTTGFVFSLEGVHGIGKSTVYSILESIFAHYTNIEFFPERLRPNPPVPFGSPDKQTAFRSELHYNQQMMARNKLLIEYIAKGRENIAIADRSPISTLVYARALGLPKVDYEIIEDTYLSTKWVDEYIIYFQASPQTIMNRIIKRGSLDQERLKWNEGDMEYVKQILSKYEELFTETKIEQKGRLIRINTDNRTPKDVTDEILQIIMDKTAIKLDRVIKTPINQKKLTDWAYL